MSAHIDPRYVENLSTPRVWGVTETGAPMRYGWDGKRLIVVRPGSAPAHRRLLWLDRNLPLAAGLALLVLFLLYRPQAPSFGLILAILPLLVGIHTVHRSTRLLRADLHILTVASVDVDNSIEGRNSRALSGIASKNYATWIGTQASASTLGFVTRRLRNSRMNRKIEVYPFARCACSSD